MFTTKKSLFAASIITLSLSAGSVTAVHAAAHEKKGEFGACPVYEAAGEAIERARSGGGPTLLECKTYRYYDHVGVRGMGLNYRTEEEVEEWKKKDAILGFEKRLKQLGVLSEKQIKTVHDKVHKDIEEAIAYAIESPYPTPDQLLEDVYYVKEG